MLVMKRNWAGDSIATVDLRDLVRDRLLHSSEDGRLEDLSRQVDQVACLLAGLVATLREKNLLSHDDMNHLLERADIPPVGFVPDEEQP